MRCANPACGNTFELNTGRGRKRKYCCGKCRTAYKRLIYAKPLGIRGKTVDCANCGRGFSQNKSTQKYCCSQCAYKARYKKKQQVFNCKTCGILFLRLPGKGYGYCSDACHPNECTYKPTIAFCDGCGSAFIAKRVTDRYCNRKCQGCAKSVCIACGVDYYTTRNSTGKYCSIACSLEHTHEERRIRRAQERREKEDAWRERNQGKTCRVSIKPCICCEREMVGPKPTKAWSGKLCQRCKDALGSAVWSSVGRVEFLKARLSGRKCEVCETLFTPYHETSTTCSKDCEKQTERYKSARAAHKAKRRAQKLTNGPYEDIDPIAVFRRDGWSCYLCGVSTPSKLRGTHEDAAPEMDHIKPLSKGGPHTWANVACACRKCNQAKSDKDVVEICGQWVVVPESGKCRGETVRLMAASQMGRAVSN